MHGKKRYSLIFLAGLFLFLPHYHIFAQNGKILNSADTLLEWAYMGMISEGRNIPTTVQSISIAEAEYYGIATEKNQEGLFLRGKVSIQPFILGWHGLDLTNRMSDSSLMNRLRLDDPILLGAVEFGSTSFYGIFQLDFINDSVVKYADSSGFLAIWEPQEYLRWWTFPEVGYFSWSNKNATVVAGRLKTGIGLGESNLFLNGQARWYDHVQFSWWTKYFRLFCLWGTSASHLNEQEYYVQTYSEQNGNSWGWDTESNHDAATQSSVPFKMFTYHRIEFKPFSRVGFGAAEMQLVGGKIPDLFNFLPAIYWHNTYTPGVSNVMLLLDAWFIPVRNVLVYGEFLMDDTRAPSESEDAKPNCWGWEIGTKVILPIPAANWRFSINFEYNHVDEWTYNRWQPYLTMYQRQLITGGWDGFDIPLGHPEGGDVDQFMLKGIALSRDGKRIEAGYVLTIKGPVYLNKIVQGAAGDPDYIPVYYDYDSGKWTATKDYFDGKVRKYIHGVTVQAVWPFPHNLEANASVDVRYVINAEHISGKKAVEVVYKMGCKWFYETKTLANRNTETQP
ncbi:capsule assembly Wzi family protein [Brucepastera parasyntrophica]|uniref:capsule assembly Wzi family protein n=1 Tax=Brucepastera parasyntrophica TaxID=2880008 RepID=UPI00210D71F4|nr:capsule assembly Wzi family protein [Brucepastera parasyntrophica]ULQ59377.1 capsule assembly Wzi family protein [Brucepastera parasyntrophica]